MAPVLVPVCPVCLAASGEECITPPDADMHQERYELLAQLRSTDDREWKVGIAMLLMLNLHYLGPSRRTA